MRVKAVSVGVNAKCLCRIEGYYVYWSWDSEILVAGRSPPSFVVVAVLDDAFFALQTTVHVVSDDERYVCVMLLIHHTFRAPLHPLFPAPSSDTASPNPNPFPSCPPELSFWTLTRILTQITLFALHCNARSCRSQHSTCGRKPKAVAFCVGQRPAQNTQACKHRRPYIIADRG